MPLPLVFYPLILIAAIFLLAYCANFLVTITTRLGHYLKLSQFITGFIILGVATSIPEASIAINSVLAGTPQLSLGNLFGATIVLLTLIAGLAAIFSQGIDVKTELKSSTRLLQISALILSPVILLLDLSLTRLDALFLLLLYLGYLIYIYRLQPHSLPLESQLMNHHFLNSIFLMAAGVIGVALSSKAIVFASLQLSSLLSIPPLAVGTLILSIGTNLPEISVAVAAIRHHHPNLIIGDILGSPAIIALVGLSSPFKIPHPILLQTTGIFLVISLAAFFVMTRSKRHLSPLEGAMAIGLYTAFLVSEISSLLLK